MPHPTQIPNSHAPEIGPVPTGIGRPLWSVMVPSFNCAKYLQQTLESVLAQDPGPDQMQIEVIDDCSTKDDPEAIVREVGRGRVGFHRKPQNEGAIANFNTCIQRSHGHLVHILHGDDYVEPGFYKTISEASQKHADAMAFFVRCFVVDAEGELQYLGERLEFLENGSRTAGRLFDHNDIYTPGVVFRREFYEKNAGFIPVLVHCADWEMWVRGITLGGGVFINKPLASYRFFEGNDTHRLWRTGENLRDNLRLAAIWEKRYETFDRGHFERLLAWRAWDQAERYRTKHDLDAFRASRQVWQELIPLPRRIAKQVSSSIRESILKWLP